MSNKNDAAQGADELSVDRDAPLRGEWTGDDGEALIHLAPNFTDTAGLLRPKAGYTPTPQDCAAINYLCNEWDYGYDPTPAAAAAAPVAQAPVVQDGYVMVPKVPTCEMYLAACRAFTAWRYKCNEEAREGSKFSQPEFEHNHVYSAMIAAAPVAAPTPVAAPVLTDAAILDMAARYFDAAGSGDYIFRVADLVAYVKRIATQAERQPQPADSMVMIGHVEEIGALENHHGTPGLVLTRDDRPPVTILMTMEDARSLSKFAFDDVTVTFSAIQQDQQAGKDGA